MTDRPNDALLLFGKALTFILQTLSGLAGAVFLALIPILALAGRAILDGTDVVRMMEASPLTVVLLLVMLAWIAICLFLFFGKMRALINSTGDGDPFIPENARRLNAMAWLLLAVQVLAVPVGLLRAGLANLVTDGDNRIDFSIYDLEGLLLVIVLLILARIFRIGTAMRTDLEGTV